MPTETSNSKEEHGVSLTSYQSPGQLLSYQPFIYLYMFVSNIYIPTPSPTNSQTFSVWLISLPAVDGSRQTGLLPINLSGLGGEGGGDRGCLPAPTSRRGEGDRSWRAQKAASAPLRLSAPLLPLRPSQLLLPPRLPGGATARHLDWGAPGI